MWEAAQDGWLGSYHDIDNWIIFIIIIDFIIID